MLLGTHCSIAGGIENSVVEAERLGIDTFQIFTKNQRQWKEKEITEAEGKSFQKKCKAAGVKVVFSHAIYLINLASTVPDIRENSAIALAGELLRCNALRLPFTVLHPGQAVGMTEGEAIFNIADAIQKILDVTKHTKVKILLENTAGQGSSIGWKFNQLSEIIERVESDRVGVCFDTCHAFAAGYDIRTKEGFEYTMNELDKEVGLKKLQAIHLNDSKGKLGSRLDRHDHIGFGNLGIETFRLVLKNFPHIPKVLETSKENNMDEKNLELLRSLI